MSRLSDDGSSFDALIQLRLGLSVGHEPVAGFGADGEEVTGCSEHGKQSLAVALAVNLKPGFGSTLVEDVRCFTDGIDPEAHLGLVGRSSLVRRGLMLGSGPALLVEHPDGNAVGLQSVGVDELDATDVVADGPDWSESLDSLVVDESEGSSVDRDDAVLLLGGSLSRTELHGSLHGFGGKSR